MRGRFKPKTQTSHEFELDLAPLLAVMVKLVPVLLISSAFMQVMVLETDLPQAVKEAVARNQNEEKPKASIQLDISKKTGIRFIIEKQGQQSVESIALKTDGTFDFAALQKMFQKIKSENPEVFRIELSPEGNVPYKEIVKIMDEARKSRDRSLKFPVFDSKQNKLVETDYMFPDVVFVNVMEG